MPAKQKAPPPPPPAAAAPSYLTKEDSLNDLLQDIHHDTQQQQNPKVQITQKRLRDTMPNDQLEVEDDENLGENFEQTPWVPPSISRAKEFRHKAIYRGGDARIDSIEIVKVSDLGAGVTLYFQFALSMAVCLFIMSLLSLPALIFAYNGQNLVAEDRDSFGLYRYTLGNIGYDAASQPSSFLCRESPAASSLTYARNETCIMVGPRVISMSQAASVMTAMEFLQVAVFFIGVFFLYRTALSVTGRNAKAETSVSDYAVVITDLPKDITDIEIVDHFSSLYRLDGRDFRHRPGVQGARPVSELHNSGGNQLLLGSWVAECVLHKGIGSFVSDFKNKAHVMEKMYRARATMKMYAENSPHRDGHNLTLFKKAEKAVHATGVIIDDITQKNLQRAGLKILAPDNESSTNKARSVSDPKSIYYHIDAPPVAAFIVFEHAESFARCLRDHAQYAHYPMRWFYPNVLKIKGCKVNVSRASEPDQILWENLEVSPRQKAYLRVRTALVTFLLVLGCFIVVLQASIYKTVFANRVPDSAVCADSVPLLYLNKTSSPLVSDVVLTRPVTASEASVLDATCVSVTGRADSFYAIYTYGGDFNRSVTRYDLSDCTLDANGLDTVIEHTVSGISGTSSSVYYSGRTDALCPEPRKDRFCPCVSTVARTECRTRDCFFPANSVESTGNCQSFSARSIGACYCYQELADLVTGGGVVDALDKINSLKNGPCGTFYSQYSLSVGLTYVSVLVTTVVNVLLRSFLKKLAKHEARSNTDEEQGSVMTKIFLSNYATMAIIILVAYGRAKDLPSVLKTLHIFDGVYEDFTPGWYGQVGYFLVTTSILQSFSPLVANLLLHYVGQPLLRWYHHAKVKALTSHSIVMQHDLNMLEVGPVFDSTDHTAQLLTLLFFSMTFAPGLPLLMPLCCFAFVLYFRVDKLLLCRYYQIPPHVGDATIRLVVHLLPYAAVLRLGIACWMFSCPQTAFGRDAALASAATASYSSFLESARSDSSGSILGFAKQRIFQAHTFPLFVLLLIVIAATLLMEIYRTIPLHLVFTRLLDCMNSLSSDGHASADARTLAEVAKHSSNTNAHAARHRQQQKQQKPQQIKKKQHQMYKNNDYDEENNGNNDYDNFDGDDNLYVPGSSSGQGVEEEEQNNEELVSAWSLAKLNDPLRQQSAGYTCEYFRYVKHRDDIPDSCYDMFAYAHLTKLSDLDREQGWQLEERGDFVVRTKVFLEAAKKLDGSRAKVGERKRTYEVVADNKCFSYDIEKVPAYATAMRGLREGTASLLEYKGLLASGQLANNGNSDGEGGGQRGATKNYDETDLANHVLSHYDRPSSAQPHHNANHHYKHNANSKDGALDVSITGHSRTKPAPHSARPQSASNNQVIPDNHHNANANVSRPGTTSNNAAGGNFTFEDFANMEFSTPADANTANNTAGNPADLHSHQSNHNSHGHHNHHNIHSQPQEKIHISKEQKQKLKKQTAASADPSYGEYP